jgi:hypothetical protein
LHLAHAEPYTALSAQPPGGSVQQGSSAAGGNLGFFSIRLAADKRYSLGQQTVSCVFEIELGTSDVIALLALLVAMLSALYACWSSYEAKKANQISLLGHKKEIYDAFFKLRRHMVQKAEFAELGEVSKFYYPSKNAKIYLPSDLAKDIEEYFDACFWIADIHRKHGGISKESNRECGRHTETEKELAPEIERKFIKLLEKGQA